MKSELFAQSNLELSGAPRFALQNSQLLRVSLGPEVLAVKGVSKSGGASASSGIGGMVLVTSTGFHTFGGAGLTGGLRTSYGEQLVPDSLEALPSGWPSPTDRSCLRRRRSCCT